MMREACIFAVRESKTLAKRNARTVVCEPPAVSTEEWRRRCSATRWKLRLCVETSTESTVLQGCLMRVAALTTLVAGARAMSLKAGAQVPKFAVTAHTGAAVSSDSLAGSAYCLWFYPKADTGG